MRASAAAVLVGHQLVVVIAVVAADEHLLVHVHLQIAAAEGHLLIIVVLVIEEHLLVPVNLFTCNFMP